MEWYEEIQQNRAEASRIKHAEYYAAPSTAAIEPFRIADDLYYVGDRWVCVHLIRTDEGLILIDAGFPCAKHLLLDSILRLGFDPRDVRWILLTHAHSDHFGAANEFRALYGTKVALSAADAASMKEFPLRAIGIKDPNLRLPVIDKELQDNEIFEFGGKKIRCVLTPGHTLGVMNFFFEVTDNGKTYLAGLFGGVGYNALTLPYILQYKLPRDMAERMLASLEKVEHEPVDIQLGNHPYNNHTVEKREQQLREGGNPFIAPEDWGNFIRRLRQKAQSIAEDNNRLEKQYLLP